MKNHITIKTMLLSSTLLVLLPAFTGCCQRCCSPSIEVSVSRPIELWTWDPITKFPREPNIKVTSSTLKSLRPYLARVKVTNHSDVAVRGATVVFYWAGFGLFDKGTPIGAVAVDLPKRNSEWVRSPWSFTLGETREYHLCLAARVFHPCDTNLQNNRCWRNFLVAVLPWPWPKLYAYPFVVDLAEHEGRIAFEVEAPDGVRARVIRKQVPEGPIDTLRGTEAVEHIVVERGVPQDMSLVIENVGADFKPGDTFDVTVTGTQNGQEVSSFTVRFQVGRES
jgi:hypothetical protein